MKDCDMTELKNDFEKALSEIDFTEYDPYSKPFMKALFIGQMYMAAKCLCDDDDVGEEIDGAKKYYDVYLESGDTSYRDMAKDELRHAGILIKKHYEKASDERKAELERYENERQELLKKIGKED